MPVNSQHSSYVKFAPKWKRVRDVCAGQDAVHDAGEAYLAKLKDQDRVEYAHMVKRTPFVNFSWRTIAALKGMLFRKPTVNKFPVGLEKYLEDVSQSGVPFGVFAENIALEVLEVGRVGILVDRPPVPEGTTLTVAQAEALGLRPVMQMYSTENIINWQQKMINNKFVLNMVVLHEMVKGPPAWGQVPDEFTVNMIDQWRVLDLDPATGNYRVRLYQRRQPGGSLNEFVQIGSDLFPILNGQPMTEIPFYFITPDGNTPAVEEPPLIDLIDLNLMHYKVSADYEHGCHFTGLPTPWVAGYRAADPEKPDTFYIGSTAAWLFNDPLAKCGYLEFTGQGLQSLKENLASKEAQMAAIGARMLAPEKSGVEAADTLFMRYSGENSILADIAISLGNGFTAALEMFAKWAGENGETSILINRDFLPVALDGRTLTAYIAAVQANLISHETMFDILQRSDVIDSELTFEQEQERIQSGTLDATALMKKVMGLLPPPKPAADPNNPGNNGDDPPKDKAA